MAHLQFSKASPALPLSTRFHPASRVKLLQSIVSVCSQGPREQTGTPQPDPQDKVIAAFESRSPTSPLSSPIDRLAFNLLTPQSLAFAAFLLQNEQ